MKPFSLIFRGMSLYFDLVVVTTTQKIFLLSRWREEMLLGKRKILPSSALVTQE